MGIRSRVAAGAVVVLLIAACAPPPSGPVPVTLQVDRSTLLGPVNPLVAGMSHNAGLASVPLVADAKPPFMRIDASLDVASIGPGLLDLGPLLAQVAAVRSIGAEPFVIISYMPTWLAGRGTGRPASRAPSDLVAWRELVRQVVDTLATAPAPARWFEVWNEPDMGDFFSAEPGFFVQMAVATHQAVADVETARGVDLRIGGPALAGVGSALLPGYLDGLARAGLVPDFVSWHRYPNEFAGPDGPEYPGQEDRFRARNPFMRPDEVAAAETRVRGLISLFFPDDAESIDTAVTEWNMSGGGLDLRNDTHEGAAFSAAALIALEAAGVDLAMVYRSVGTTRPGDYGVVDLAGERVPSFEVFREFVAMTGQRVALSGADANLGLWARATGDIDGGEVMIAAYGANPWLAFDRDLRVEGLGRSSVEASLLTAGGAGFEPVALDQDGDVVSVRLPAQSVLRLRWSATP